jgi:hypothetical protein
MEQLFEICRFFLSSPRSCYVFSKELGIEYFFVLEMMELSFKLKAEGKTPDNIDGNLLMKCTEHLLGIMYSRFLEPELKDFILSFVIIVENFCKDFYRNEDLQERISFLRRVTSDSSPLLEKIRLLEETCSRLTNEINCLNVPGFKISEHYFNIIKEEN